MTHASSVCSIKHFLIPLIAKRRGEHETGMSRLALTDADKHARDWFVHTAKSLGCHVSVDAMGNTFAVRPGRRQRRGFPPTCAGSHLDTQPTGGRYDGILGVCAGLEMLRVLHEEKVETEFPVGVVNWTKYVCYAMVPEPARFFFVGLGVCFQLPSHAKFST